MRQNERHKNAAGKGADGRGELHAGGLKQVLTLRTLELGPTAGVGADIEGSSDAGVCDAQLASWATRYLSSEVVGVQSPNTLATKTRDLRAFIRWYIEANGHDQIPDWMPRDTRAFMAHLEDAGRAATSVNRVLAHLRHFAKWCQQQPGGVFALGGLPTRGIKELATEDSTCKKLDEREMHLILKAADAMVLQSRHEDGRVRHRSARPRRNRALLVLMQQTGLRISEAVRLRRRQYDGGFLWHAQRKGKGRTAKLYLPTSCRAALDSYLEHEWPQDAGTLEETAPADVLQPAAVAGQGSVADAPLFAGVHGDALDRKQVNRIFAKLAQEASKHQKEPIALHPHRLRHTFGDRHRAKSGSDAETAAALGHTSTENWPYAPLWLFAEPLYTVAKTLLREAGRDGFEATVKAYLDSDRGLIERFNRGLHTASKSLEQVMIDVADNHDRSPKAAVVHAVVDILACCMLSGAGAFAEGRDLYDQLFSLPQLQDGLGIITPNNDILAEEALSRVRPGDFYAYPATAAQHEVTVPIYKWNGSCNWLVTQPDGGGSSLELAERRRRLSPPSGLGPDDSYETGLQDTRQSYRRNVALKLRDEPESPGIIVAMYAPGKPLAHNYDYIAQTHRLCLGTIQANPEADVTVIGLHLPGPGDDLRMNDVLSELRQIRGRKKYVNPDRAECQRAEQWGFEFCDMELHKYLEHLRTS